MATDGDDLPGSLPPSRETDDDRGTSSLDRLAAWSVDTQSFVRKFGDFYRRWSARPPNSPGQRTTFERALKDLVADAGSLEVRLRDIGSSLAHPRETHELDGGDRAAVEVYEQLTRTGFLDAWRLMSRLLERQVAEAQEPKTAEEWRTYFRRFDAVWEGARDLGKVARAVQGMLEELRLVRVPRREGADVVLDLDYQPTPLEEVSDLCGELVAFLVSEGVLRDDGRPPTSSQDIVKSYGAGGVERIRPLMERLDRYLDVVDRLIAALKESRFLRIEGAVGEAVARACQLQRQLLACAQHRFDIANNVLHAMLQMVDPIYVSPREALRHARDARDVLRDLEMRDRDFGRAIVQAESKLAATLSAVGEPRPWGDLDDVERAIVSHLIEHPSSTRREVETAIPRFSPATVRRRLEDLESEGVVEHRRDGGDDEHVGGLGKPKLSSRTAKGGSLPFVYRLTARGERLYRGAGGT